MTKLIDTLATAFGLAGGTFRQYLAGLTISLSVIILGTAIGWPAPSIPILLGDKSPVPLSEWQISWMVAFMYLANVISPIPAGYLMDRIGRKYSTMYLMIFPILSWITLLCATQPYHLYIGRFLVGLSFGVVYTIVPIYNAEVSETHLRGVLGNFIAVMTYGGALYVYCVGPYVNYYTLIYSCLLVPVVAAIAIIWIPESPYYLLMVDDRTNAMKSLKWLRNDKTNEEISKELDDMEVNTKRQLESSSKFVDLISTPGNRKALTIVLVLAISQRLTGVGTLMAFSSVTIPEKSIPNLGSKECVTILGIVWFLSSIISSFLVERLGRKFLLCISSAGCGLSTFLSCIWFYIDDFTDISTDDFRWVPFVSFMFHALFYSLGIGPIGSAIKGELFPANIKGKSSAIATMVMAFTSFVLNKVYLPLGNRYGMYINFLIFTLNCILTIIFVMVYMIETKGKTLEEIQVELNMVHKKEKIVDNNNIQSIS